MKELKGFGINPLTKKEIVWTAYKEENRYFCNKEYKATYYVSDMVKTMSVEDLLDFISNNTDYEVDIVDKDVMPSLNLAQQEEVVVNHIRFNYMSKTPKRIKQVFTIARNYDFSMCAPQYDYIHPTTGELMSYVCGIHKNYCNISYVDASGTRKLAYFSSTGYYSAEDVKSFVGNEVGFALRYVKYEPVEEE